MGRRKIEIKAIKDDRNRSVTFLKRKGGLFKKAHELSVLTSVDVAVIIFGHNNKLFEYCSSKDLPDFLARYQYARGHYGGAHEHKDPDDYTGMKDDDDDDEDETGDHADSHSPPQQAMMTHHLQSQPSFQHLGGTPSASPPMSNGAFHPRQGTPHSIPHISRPDSRSHVRLPSNGVQLPTGISQPPPGQGNSNYAYMPNPPIYQPQTAARSQPQQSPYPQSYTPQPQQQQQSQQQQQQVYPQDQRLQVPTSQPQQTHQQQSRHSPEMKSSVESPEPQQHAQFHSPPQPQPRSLPASKAHSIFTPIDDSRSLLARHWDSNPEPRKLDPPPKPSDNRSQSLDVGPIKRSVNGLPGPAPTSNPPPPQRTSSSPSLSTLAGMPPSRTNSMASDAKRPRLKVQIPLDEDDSDRTPKSASANSPATQRPQRDSNSTLTPIREGPLLPPPSPSASALLSAGATGPRNPFARPPPPSQSNGDRDRSDIATPISALPSRFINEQLLPSPSSFMPEWNFGRNEGTGGNMLPSPMNFQTPINPTGPSFSRTDVGVDKRKAEDMEKDEKDMLQPKRAKT